MTYYERFLENKEEELRDAKEVIKNRASTLSDRMKEVAEGDRTIFGVQDLEGTIHWLKQSVLEVEKLQTEIRIMKETRQALDVYV